MVAVGRFVGASRKKRRRKDRLGLPPLMTLTPLSFTVRFLGFILLGLSKVLYGAADVLAVLESQGNTVVILEIVALLQFLWRWRRSWRFVFG